MWTEITGTSFLARIRIGRDSEPFEPVCTKTAVERDSKTVVTEWWGGKERTPIPKDDLASVLFNERAEAWLMTVARTGKQRSYFMWLPKPGKHVGCAVDIVGTENE
jgi:hypothetical protein